MNDLKEEKKCCQQKNLDLIFCNWSEKKNQKETFFLLKILRPDLVGPVASSRRRRRVGENENDFSESKWEFFVR